MRTVFKAVRSANRRNLSTATFDHKLWSKWRDELSYRSSPLYRRILGRRDLGNDEQAKALEEGLQCFWNETNELVSTFGTPELDDQLSGAIYMQGYPKEVA